MMRGPALEYQRRVYSHFTCDWCARTLDWCRAQPPLFLP